MKCVHGVDIEKRCRRFDTVHRGNQGRGGPGVNIGLTEGRVREIVREEFRRMLDEAQRQPRQNPLREPVR